MYHYVNTFLFAFSDTIKAVDTVLLICNFLRPENWVMKEGTFTVDSSLSKDMHLKQKLVISVPFVIWNFGTLL